MHILHLNYFYDPEIPSADALLDRYYTTAHLCTNLRAAGVEQVSVVQRFTDNARLVREGVTWHFVADALGNRLRAWRNPRAIHRLVARLEPDVIHHHGMARPLRRLKPLLRRGTKIVWQHHGGRGPGRVQCWLERPGFRALDAVAFTSREQAGPWRTADLVRTGHEVYELMEGSSTFCPQPRESCRQKLGIAGNPALLWVGRLNANKDPLTVLEGLARVKSQLHDPQLYMVYGEDDLLADVRSAIAKLDLGDRVHLWGKRPHAALEELYSAADFFVLGSHQEGSGFALLEALACGLTPAVTDIPSFRRITDGGRLGRLWRPGSAESFAAAIVAAANEPRRPERIRRYFEEQWSFPAIARAAADMYHDLAKR